MNIKLASLNIEVADVARSVAFYTAVLGMEEDRDRSHPPTFAYLKSPTCAITLTTPNEAPAPEPSRTMEVGFETDDLAAFQEKLAALGVAGARPQSMGWGSAVELCDPDGYRVVVCAFRRD